VGYGDLCRQFRGAPAGKLYCLHGDDSVFRLSLTAAASVLLNGVPLVVVDGTNRFDLYYITEFARRWGRGSAPSAVLDRIFISRAFTCYQMEAVVTERLGPFMQRAGAPVALIFGLLDTFYDEQAPLFEVRGCLERVVGALAELKRSNVSVLLASRDWHPAAAGRGMLFPRLAASMDRVFALRRDDQALRITAEGSQRAGGSHGTHGPHIYDGPAAGTGQLGKIPAGAAQRGPGRSG